MDEIVLQTEYFTAKENDGSLIVTNANNKILTFKDVTRCYHHSDNGVEKIKWESSKEGQRKLRVLDYEFSHNNHYLIIDNDNKCVLYQKNVASEGLYNGIWEITIYDFNLCEIEKVYGKATDNSHHYAKLCSIIEGHQYFICENQLRVFDMWKGNVKVHSYNKPPLIFRGILSCKQVTQKIDNATFLYSFYILEAKRLKIVLNTRTLAYKALAFNNVFPTVGSFLSTKYLFEHTYILDSEDEHLVIDDVLYDSNLDIVATLPISTSSEIVDIFEYYVSSISSNGNLSILKINEKWTSVIRIPYFYNLKDSKGSLTIGNRAIHHIDNNTGKFIFNHKMLYDEYMDSCRRITEDDIESYWRYIEEDIGYDNLDY